MRSYLHIALKLKSYFEQSSSGTTSDQGKLFATAYWIDLLSRDHFTPEQLEKLQHLVSESSDKSCGWQELSFYVGRWITENAQM